MLKTAPSANAGSTNPASPPPGPEPEVRASDDTQDGATDAPVEKPAKRVGRYLVIDRLGHGGMGVVLEAFDPELDRRVALKLLHPERARGASRLRLLREAQALARLSHPNVVQVYDVGVDGDQVFMAMELVRGRTISAWLQEERRPWTEILARFVAAGRGLQAAHTAGLVHRDFKPHNVLVGDDGRVRVADFGLAGVEDKPLPSPAHEGPATTSYLATPLTATGAILGTPRYMAPEQHTGLEVGPAADQFAFCVALYEAVLGSHPFAGETPFELVANVLAGRITMPPSTSAVPKWLVTAIRRGLARDPTDRHPGMEPLLHVLEREPLRRRRRQLGALGLVLGFGAVATAWMGRADVVPCTGGPAAVAEIWSDPQRNAVTDALVVEPGVGDVVVRTLDAYAEQWAQSHREVCLEHRDEAMSPAMFERAMGCLQRGRAALAGVVDTVATAEPEVVRASALAAASLPAPSLCHDREILARDFGLPDDPAEAAIAAGLRDRLARAEAVHDAGALEPALDELDALEREVVELGHAPLEAERALVAGRLAMDRSDWTLARRELSVAFAKSVVSGTDAIAAETMARTLFVDAMFVDPHDLDPRDEAAAAAFVERVGSPPDLAALLANNIAVRQAMSGHPRDAAQAFLQALALADVAEGVEPVDHCGYILNVARHTADPIKRDALFVRAEQLAERWLGPGHEKTLEIAVLRARHTVDPSAAIVRLAPPCTSLRPDAAMEWSRCLCHEHLAQLHEYLGAELAARAALAAALRCFEDIGLPATRDLAVPVRIKLEGHAALLRGEYDDALENLDAAEQDLQTRRDLPWIARQLADIAFLRARSLQGLGRGAEAIAPLRSAIATYDGEITLTEERAPREHRERATRLLAELEAQRRSSIENSSSQR